MKIVTTKTVSPKGAFAGIKKTLRKADKAGATGNHSGRLDKDTKYKLQLVATELDNLAAVQDVITQHYTKIKAKNEEGKK